MKKSIKVMSVLMMILFLFAGSASAATLLRVGSKGSDVSQLQTQLQSLAYSPGKADGIFGSKTKNAVSDFQGDHNLTVDGIVGSKTSSAIKEKASNGNSKKTNQTSSSPSNVSLRYGNRGSDVKQLQNTLNSIGYSAGNADGVFGLQTQRAVRAIQSDFGLSVDGIVGSKTYDVIEKARSGGSSLANRGGSTDSLIDNVIDTAKDHIGVPYRTAGTTPSGFDCSGFTQYVMKENGINIPRSSGSQYNTGTSVSRNGLRKGDFVFFNTSGSGVSHVGIYVGNNSFISSTSSKGIAVVSLSNSYWSPKYMGARRII